MAVAGDGLHPDFNELLIPAKFVDIIQQCFLNDEKRPNFATIFDQVNDYVNVSATSQKL